MTLAGFDLATTSGAAILRGDKIVHAEAFRPQGKEDSQVFAGFRGWFRTMLLAYEVEQVAIEQPLVTDIRAPVRREGAQPGETHNPVTMKTYLRLYGLRAHAVEIAGSLNIPLLEAHQSSWRKSFTGNGRATKDDTLALAKRLYPSLKSKDAAEAVGIVWHLSGVLRQASLVRPGDLFEERKAS
jgi:hypothetical protein